MKSLSTMAINDNFFMAINANRNCRICLQENTNLSPIFCNGQSIDNLSDIAEKIKVCGAVECHEQDGLPSMICDSCIYKASVAYEFRQLCQYSDTRLRLCYNKPPRYNATVTKLYPYHCNNFITLYLKKLI